MLFLIQRRIYRVKNMCRSQSSMSFIQFVAITPTEEALCGELRRQQNKQPPSLKFANKTRETMQQSEQILYCQEKNKNFLKIF